MGGSKHKLVLADIEALEKQSFHLSAVTGIVFEMA